MTIRLEVVFVSPQHSYSLLGKNTVRGVGVMVHFLKSRISALIILNSSKWEIYLSSPFIYLFHHLFICKYEFMDIYPMDYNPIIIYIIHKLF